VLDMVIADKTKNTALCKDGRVVIDGPISKMKNEPRCDTVSVDDLGRLARGDRRPVKGLESKESMAGTLTVSHRDGLAIDPAHKVSGN